MPYVDTQREAEEMQQDFEKMQQQLLCPLLHAPCKPNCVCYVAAEYSESDERYIVYEAHCNNRMLMGNY